MKGMQYAPRVLYFSAFHYTGNARAPVERTDLHDAAKRGDVEAIKRLISNSSVDKNLRNMNVRLFLTLYTM